MISNVEVEGYNRSEELSVVIFILDIFSPRDSQSRSARSEAVTMNTV